ncbi:periplasmic heavy metal sensor [Mesorhizobium sp.]|uniref:periplasmic heavy metal sensor n=1 Tax=Mesorhizobium sp. TaxID=1871066 RepID=UPI0025D03A53|nr:periplasmic heavy metal sensor [Mesorhizobium sp.]
MEAARAGREAVARLIEAEPIDAAAINATLASVRQADMALRGRLEQAIVTFATGLTPADRARLVDGLRGRTNMLRRAHEK